MADLNVGSLRLTRGGQLALGEGSGPGFHAESSPRRALGHGPALPKVARGPVEVASRKGRRGPGHLRVRKKKAAIIIPPAASARQL
jgi:hypothetical protein